MRTGHRGSPVRHLRCPARPALLLGPNKGTHLFSSLPSSGDKPGQHFASMARVRFVADFLRSSMLWLLCWPCLPCCPASISKHRARRRQRARCILRHGSITLPARRTNQAVPQARPPASAPRSDSANALRSRKRPSSARKGPRCRTSPATAGSNLDETTPRACFSAPARLQPGHDALRLDESNLSANHFMKLFSNSERGRQTR